MKKLYFQLAAMHVGGVEKSFLGLLTTLSKEKYEIHVGLLHLDGGYMECLPKHVIIHHVTCYKSLIKLINDPPLSYIKRFIYECKFLDAFMHFCFYLLYKISKDRYYFYKYIMRHVPVEPDVYDMAFAYAGPSQMLDFYVCEKIQAKHKYGWIHFDVQKFGIDPGMTRHLYKNFDKIYVVSETAKKKFDTLFPEFCNKTEVRYNIVQKSRILESAKLGETFSDCFYGKRILTVGRISIEKGQDVSLDALKILVENGYDVKWYYIGDGAQINACKKKAVHLNLTDRVAFLGVKTNPYGYMRDCDIYVQPSRHEGYCLTLAEARCFNSPIVATCFTGASEQLQSSPMSVITGMSAEDIAMGIIKFL